MKKLLKMGLVVPMLVLALAFTGVVMAADQNDKELNQDLNRDLNKSEGKARSSEALTLDDSALDSEDGTTVNAEDATGTATSRRGSLDRRGRAATKTSVSLATAQNKWWNSHGHNNDDEGDDEVPDDEDEGDDEDPPVTEIYP